MKAAQWTATAKSPSRPPARHGAGALPTVEMCRLREGPFAGRDGKKNQPNLLLGLENGMVRRHRLGSVKGNGATAAPGGFGAKPGGGASVGTAEDAGSPFPEGCVPNPGWGLEERGCSEGRSAGWGQLGDGVRAGGRSAGLREDETAAMWPAAASAPRLNASQDTPGAGAGSGDALPAAGRGAKGHAAPCSPADAGAAGAAKNGEFGGARSPGCGGGDVQSCVWGSALRVKTPKRVIFVGMFRPEAGVGGVRALPG